jgi:putative ABC transport system permease protein
VAIISRRAARTFFGRDNPVGRHIVVDLGAPLTFEVVGVTGDVRVFGQANESPEMVYMHGGQRPFPGMQVVIRSSASMSDIAGTLRGTVASLDPALPIARVERMESLLADSVAQPRFAMLLIGSFAGMALVLTMVGLHGTLAYLVARRRREFGIRVAMGATRRDIGRLVVRQAAVLAAAGIPLGLLATRIAWPFVSQYLFDGRPVDPVIVTGVSAFLGMSSVGAALVPARRAAGVEPVVALRDE